MGLLFKAYSMGCLFKAYSMGLLFKAYSMGLFFKAYSMGFLFKAYSMGLLFKGYIRLYIRKLTIAHKQKDPANNVFWFAREGNISGRRSGLASLRCRGLPKP